MSADAVTSAITTALTKADPSMSVGRASAIVQRMLQGPPASRAADRDGDDDGH